LLKTTTVSRSKSQKTTSRGSVEHSFTGKKTASGNWKLIQIKALCSDKVFLESYDTVRQRNVELIMAFAKIIKFTNNNLCELQVGLHQMEWCEDTINAHITLDIDSFMAFNMIKKFVTISLDIKKD